MVFSSVNQVSEQCISYQLAMTIKWDDKYKIISISVTSVVNHSCLVSVVNSKIHSDHMNKKLYLSDNFYNNVSLSKSLPKKKTKS